MGYLLKLLKIIKNYKGKGKSIMNKLNILPKIAYFDLNMFEKGRNLTDEMKRARSDVTKPFPFPFF